ncbi:MAG: hypothetical protein GX072_07410, partial [Lysinibacillus sp.]|nr:hypothetical protein [Lysinibacillus sp.]
IRRTEAMLEEYEEKLKLFEKFQKRQQTIEKLAAAIKGNASIEEQLKLIDQLKETD